MMKGYIPKMTDANLEKEFIRDPVVYGRKLQRVIVTDRFGSSGEKLNNFVLVSDDVNESGGV